MSEVPSETGGITRLSFIKGSAVAAGGAVIAAAPAALILDDSKPAAIDTRKVVAKPAPTPREPVMAYIRNAERGEVTVMSGTRETTYRDKTLVDRLLAAAAPHNTIVAGGGANVIAP